MLILLDSFWVKAKVRVEALGHKEEEDPARFETLVRSAYQDECRKQRRLAKSGVMRRVLMKSIGMEPKAKPKAVKKKTTTGSPVVGGWAHGQRPDRDGSVHGRVVSVGKDGIVIRDDKGAKHRVRHEHVIEHQKPVTEQEWARAAKVLSESGEKVDPISRFKKPEKKVRPDAKSKKGVLNLARTHKEIDAKRALKEGSPSDIAALIEYYKGKKVKK